VATCRWLASFVNYASFPAALPAIHPLAAIGVLVLFPHRLRGMEEVFLLREVIVCRIQNRPAEALGGKVERVAEVAHDLLEKC
jgi:hypothetical protein